MKNQKLAGCLAVLLLTGLTATAQTQTKANNNTALNVAGSWVSGVLPLSTDVVIWDSTVATIANCTNNIGGTTSWGGIQILNPAASVVITNNKALTLGTSGIDMANSTVDLNLNVPVTTSGAQSWNIKPGRTLTAGIPGSSGQAVIVGSDLSINGYVNFNSKDFRVGVSTPLTLDLTNASTTLDFSAGLPSFSVGYAANGTVNQTAGKVNLLKNSTSTGALLIGASGTGPFVSTYNLMGGSIVDTNPTTADYISVGDASGCTGYLNVNGGTVSVPQIQIGNKGFGYVNLTNGTITTGNSPGNDLIVNKGGSSLGGWLNVYGGTVTIPNHSLVVGKGGPTGLGSQATVYLASPGVINVGTSLQIPGGSANPGTVTMDGGFMTVTSSVTLLSSGAGDGTLNLNGGTLTASSVGIGAGTGIAQLNFNGGTLAARGGTATFVAANVPAYMKAGGAVINNGGFNITIPAALANGTGGGADGGLTALGAGTLTLTGNNTYNGTTTVGGGILAVGTTNLAGGTILPGSAAIAVTNGTLDTVLATDGTTLVCSSLAFSGAGGTVGAQFDCSTNSNPSAPLIYATNLMASGTVNVSIYGSGLTVGTFPLIQYNGSLGGGGAFTLAFMQGGSGYITNNAAAHQVQLVMTGVSYLAWRAKVSPNWDTATANWWDLSNSVFTAFGNGAVVTFDDNTSNALVNVAGTVLPTTTTINNNSSNYVFAGTGGIGGIGGLLNKFGAGTVTMSLSNSYTGGTVISNGVFRLGTNYAIPSVSDTVVEGKLDLAGYSTGIHALNGTNGIVDNSGTNQSVLAIGGNGGSFAGLITNSGSGGLVLNKTGGSLYLLNPSNGYTGGTTNGGGLLQLASEKSIGSGPLTLNGGTLAWPDTIPHTLTNVVAMGGGGVTLGSTNVNNGLLTIQRVVDFQGSGHGITCNEDALLVNGMTNGSLNNKSGSGTLTLKNTSADWNSGSLSVNLGTLILDGGSITQDGSNVRIQCSTTGTARLVITNGGTFAMNGSSTANFRFGDNANGGVDAINIVDIYGTLNLMPVAGASSSSNNKFQMGSSTDPSGQNIANLMTGGVLRTKQVLDQSGASISTFNFNGGTLMVSTNDQAANFMNGLDNCYVLDGGAIIDTAGYSVTIAQTLQPGGSGTGGLTKQGQGTLYLSGYNSFTGPTLVAAGTLSGSGSLYSPVTVASGGTLSAGPSATNTGNFAIYNTVTFNPGGSAALKVTKLYGSPVSDNLSATTVHYAGTLVVTTNVDMTDAFADGDIFTLFTASTAYTGSFSAYNLPALVPGLGWDTSHLTTDGSLRIKTVPLAPPVFHQPVFSGSNLVLSGSGGSPGGTYYVVATTNLALPLASWTPVATNTFDGSGDFSFTNTVAPGTPGRFYDFYYNP